MQDLDLSSTVQIYLPKIPRPQPEKKRKPIEYWRIYKKGYSYYKRKWYEKSKNEFLKLYKFENPHRDLDSLLLAVYRKLLDKYIKLGKLKGAYELYIEFFSLFKNAISNRDKTKFNGVIKKLENKFPGVEYRKLNLDKYESNPDFEIKKFENINLKLISDEKTDKDKFLHMWKWNFIKKVYDGTIFIKRLYNKKLSKFDRSYVLFINRKGNIKSESTINYSVYHINAAESSNKFITISDDVKLYMHDLSNGNIEGHDLGFDIDDKYQVRCVDISPFGDFILYTHINKVFLLNMKFKEIASWKIPPTDYVDAEYNNEGWNRESYFSNKYSKSLSLLGLSGKPSIEQIKKEFRNRIRTHHPDFNPNDLRANETTIALIQAYEELTGEEAQKAFSKEKDVQFYNMVKKIKFKISGDNFSTSYTIGIYMLGGGGVREWIFSTYLSSNAERIYVGCYSGRVFCISKNGKVLKEYNCHDGVEEIKERGRYLFIKTWYGLYIIKDDKYLNYLRILKTEDIHWMDRGFILVSEKYIKIFTNEGIILFRINFKKIRIYYVFWERNMLYLITAKKTYI